MTLYAYCVRRCGDPPPEAGVRGVEGAEVVLLEGARLGLWASPVEHPPRPEPERLRAHDRVVRAALRTATPLPLRFGATFPDAGAALAALSAREAELLATLRRVEGRVEVGVAVLWDAAAERERLLAERPELRPEPGKPSGGREYLERRRREQALEGALRERAAGLLQSVAEHLAGVDPSAAEARSVLAGPELAGAVAHLVRREHLFSYRETALRAGEGLPGARLRLSGPWAPYSFV